MNFNANLIRLSLLCVIALYQKKKPISKVKKVASPSKVSKANTAKSTPRALNLEKKSKADSSVNTPKSKPK